MPALFFVLFSSAVYAQSSTAVLQGVVSDSQGGVLPGVAVVVTNTETGLAREATSDAAGFFRASALPPGPYSVEAKLDGFASYSRTGLVLTIGQTATVDVQLALVASDARFKAAISGAGSANHTSLYGHDQYTFLYDNEFGPPWKNTDLWLKFSYPFFHADRIKTPVPTELVVYPGQNHGLTRVSFLRDRYERYVAWYDGYLKTGAPAKSDAPTKPHQLN